MKEVRAEQLEPGMLIAESESKAHLAVEVLSIRKRNGWVVITVDTGEAGSSDAHPLKLEPVRPGTKITVTGKPGDPLWRA